MPYPIKKVSFAIPVAATLLLLFTSCFHLPAENPAYYACRNGCMQKKDNCILKARTAEQVQSCNRQLSTCLQACPSEYVQQSDAHEP